MKPIFSLCCFCFIALIGFAQPGKTYETKKTVGKKAIAYYEEGRRKSFNGELNKALNLFNKALSEEPNFIDALIFWAGVHYELKEYALAESGFEKVVSLDEKYSKKAWCSLAFAEMRQKKLSEAVEHFKKYISLNPRNEILLGKAQQYVADLSVLAKAMQKPVPYQPESLGDLINTTDSWEYLPSLTADGKTMIYTKRVGGKNGQEDFYLSRFVNGQWQTGEPISSLNRPRNDEGAQSISPDGKMIVFTICFEKGLGGCELFLSEKIKGRWTKPTKMEPPVNSRAYDSQPSIAPDKQQIYFSSSRKGGYGGTDIYVTKRLENGKWSTPENLGPTINTSKNEYYPFIHMDGSTLYFISTGHPGMGEEDIYFSRKNEDGKWGKPVNLGFPINTPSSETNLIVSLDGKTAYFSSNAKNPADFGKISFEKNPLTAQSNIDLYQFELYEAARPQAVTYVKATVIDADTKQPLVAKTDFIILPENKTHLKGSTDKAGEFLVCLPIGNDYALNVNKPGYLFHSENFALAGKATLEDPFLLEIELQRIPEATPDAAPVVSKPVILKNVFFDTGSADLRPASFVELDRLKNLLEENASIKIQISGHTDNVGEDTDNMTLSDDRANAVLNYLVENGIESNRLSAKGYGETKPIDTNDTKAGRQNNRRTEFVIVN